MTRVVELRGTYSDSPCLECDGTGRALVSRSLCGEDAQEEDCLFCGGTGRLLQPIAFDRIVRELSGDA